MFDESKALAKLYFCVVNAGGVAERFLTNSNKVTTWGCGLETRFFYMLRGLCSSLLPNQLSCRTEQRSEYSMHFVVTYRSFHV